MNMNLNYDKQNNGIAFREIDHVYFNLKNPSVKYTSVTQILGSYHEKFDSKFFSKYKTLEKLMDVDDFKKVKAKLLSKKPNFDEEILDQYDIDKEQFEHELAALLAEWKANTEEACARGTAYHLKRENALYQRDNVLDMSNNLFKVPVEGKFYCKKNDFSLEQENAVLPEFLVYYTSPDGELNIAGQVDVLIKQGNDIYICDFKTNAKGITSKAYFDKSKRSTKSMFYPINNLDDHTLNHYTLQLSTYAWMLQKINPDFNIRLLRLIHSDLEENETYYDVPYLKDEVARMLAHFKKQTRINKDREKHRMLK